MEYASVFGTIRQNCEIAGETHYRGDGTTRRKRNENGTWRKRMAMCMLRVCMHTYVHPEDGMPKVREGWKRAQFCSVNPWRRARGVYHSASEFVVPRLVTNKSVFRIQLRALLSHPLCRPRSISLPSTLPPFHPVLRLFTCITFAEDTRKTLTRASVRSRSRPRNLAQSEERSHKI